MSDNNNGYDYNNAGGQRQTGKAPSKKKGIWMIALAALCLVYIVSPIDAIPDFIAGLGQIDDLGALVGMVSSVIMAIKGFKAGRASAQDENVNDVDSN